MILLRRGATASLLSLLLLGSGMAAAADLRSEYRLSTVVGTDHPWGQAGLRWAELVRERTRGRIPIRLHADGALFKGNQGQEFTSIRQGGIDLAIGSTINWSPQVKELNLFSLPFLMPDYRAIDGLTQGEVGREIFKAIEIHEVVPLAWGENGFREISNSRRPLRAPEDLRGLKIRFAVSPIFAETLAALGANPVQINFADLKPALAANAIDGQENPLPIFTAYQLQTVGQRYLSLWRYVADPLVFVVNREVWTGWSPEDRELVREAAIQAGRENIAAARRGITAEDGTVIRDLETRGVTVIRLSSREREAFRAATRPVYEKWARIIGPDLVRRAEAAISDR
jgi:tripartite ATP-independent transporter DctP family solute receptor